MSTVNLKSLVRKVLQEEMAQTKVRGRLSEKSVDDQIDSMLIQFESVSIRESVNDKYSLMFLLEAKPSEEEEGKADEEPSKKVTTSDESQVFEPSTPAKPPVDLDQFALRVSRLVKNFSSLLDVPTVILTRTKNFVTENYGEPEALKLMEILESEFSLTLHPADNEPERPNAAGAGPV
jgi:hypothetical protein